MPSAAYLRRLNNPRRASCHPDRRHYSKGLCQSCYQRHGYARRTADKPRKRRAPGPPDCHPDRPHAGLGMCGACYQAHRHQRDPEHNRRLSREWRKKNPQKRRHQTRKGNLKWKFGLTVEQYDAMVAAQGGLCALCRCPERKLAKRLAVDHCHVTGVVRDLLCGPCNVVLGYIENPEWFGRAQAYLVKHRARGAA